MLHGPGTKQEYVVQVADTSLASHKHLGNKALEDGCGIHQSHWQTSDVKIESKLRFGVEFYPRK
uniref:Uncharacterized protein n=1 Tax=Romanomermis culicivorax TaxID=13658 RepID=A0A915JGZ4_ROMCU